MGQRHSLKKPAMEDYQSCRERTEKTLCLLAEHWSKDEVGRSVNSLLKDPDGFSEEGFSWSSTVGLNFVLPKEAICCEPISGSQGRDGLLPSNAGGPQVATSPDLIVAPAPPCGFGVFATCKIPKGAILGEYSGEIRNYKIWCDEITGKKKTRRGSEAASPFIRDELYAAWGGSGPQDAGVVVDAFALGNAIRFVNCSCFPNCTFKNFGTGAQGHYRLKVQALREIEAWQQLSVDYGWYHDPPTLEEIRKESVTAYTADLELLQKLVLPKSSAQAASGSAARPAEVVAEALQEARGRPATRTAPPHFLHRFVDGEDVARFLETGKAFEKAESYLEIPAPVWQLYEVVGAERVGISCMCALDPSLNNSGRCAGIIGRPMQ
eukprot:CAMPEP_0197638724 /NCGR_PEP_ID=MMETSP1338-20131121/13571_1 /TAXON_ID=43686 ORGANISM="Pelagodinium beii, Strain RCC1491" /NCGR_SAMPLE_ID=MMETSP1338 /ASSEMBLY_ACC=CAM_ASM_000754 /LENGTH=378 /DNA_ID=CAMNT_0043211351 /DNA_START=54 /DNA_END=1187 /DNA_ORIENTATION=-